MENAIDGNMGMGLDLELWFRLFIAAYGNLCGDRLRVDIRLDIFDRLSWVL